MCYVLITDVYVHVIRLVSTKDSHDLFTQLCDYISVGYFYDAASSYTKERRMVG
jgi:hypothetical protein